MPRHLARPRNVVAQALVVLRLVAEAAPAAAIQQIALATISSTVPIASAWCIKTVLDSLSRPNAGSVVAMAIAALALAHVADDVATVLSQGLSGRLRRALRTVVYGNLYAAVNTIPTLDPLEDPAFQDQLKLAEAAGDHGPDQLITGVLNMVRSAVLLLGWIGSLWLVWPPMVLVLAVIVVPAVSIGQKSAQMEAALRERLAPSGRRRFFFRSLLLEARAAKEVRLFGAGQYLRSRLLQLLAEDHQKEAFVERKRVEWDLRLALLTSVALGVGFAVAAYGALNGEVSVGGFTLFVSAAAGAQAAVAVAAAGVASSYSTLLMFSHYASFLTERTNWAPGLAASAPDDHIASSSIRALTHGIEFRGVWFRYGPDQPWVLEDVHAFIPAGTAVGIVGENGAGKSTLIKLLCGLYRPTKGAIYWDGVDIARLDLASLRRSMTVVYQDFMSYELTVAENLAIADLSALEDMHRLRKVAERVGLNHAIESLPAGFHTLLSKVFMPDGEGQTTMLSGGQWQRLAIARALMREDAALAIFDEPMSGLDPGAQHELRMAMAGFAEGRTMLLVSHHLGAIRRAAQILVLCQGRIIERGSHDQLMTLGGAYRRLFSSQAESYAMT